MERHERFDAYLAERHNDPALAREYLDVACQEYEADGDRGAFVLALQRVLAAHGGTEESILAH